MEEDFNFEDFSVNIDSDCVANDFDDYDLYGEIMEDDNHDDYGNDIKFE